MAHVTFATNELRGRDETLAERLETEIRGAASRFDTAEAALQCRILLEPALGAGVARIRIQFERPGWVKTFGLSAAAPVDDARRATSRIFDGQ